MLGDQEGEVGVARVLGRILVAVAVDGDDAVGVLVDHHAMGIHAEGAHQILELLCAVDDLGLVQLVGEVGEDLGGQLHADTDVHAVGLSGDGQITADTLHPLTAAPSRGDHALVAGILLAAADHHVAVIRLSDRIHGGAEEEVHLLLQLVVEVLQHDVVDIGAEVADGGVQQVESVLHAELLDIGISRGVEVSSLAAVGQVDLVHVLHELGGLGLANVLVEGAAEAVGDVVLTVREGTRAAEAVHDGAGLTAKAGLDLHPVDGALALLQRVAGLEDGDLEVRGQAGQLIGGEDTAGACADDDHIVLIFHNVWFPFVFCGGRRSEG